MAEAFVELGAEGVNWVTDKYFESGYDKVQQRFKGKKGNQNNQKDQNSQGRRGTYDETYETKENVAVGGPNQQYSTVSGRQRRHQNRLPSPEGKPGARDIPRNNQPPRSPSLDRESLRSEQVIRAYEADPRDPPARPETVLSKKDLKKLRRESRMSYANGYGGGSNMQAPYDSRRPQSQQPAKSRYYDDDDSDYDERTGRRYRTTGRGYDDGYDDDRDYDREVVTTERYRGPARQSFDARRDSYNTSRSYGNQEAGAVTRYDRRSEVDDYQSKRSRSRGRRDKDRERDRSESRSRSGSEHSGIRGKIDDTFDTSMQGLGVGLAGAVVGGLAGREFGNKHKNRDILLGALIGGLGANAAENKWKDWKDEKKRDLREDEDRFEQKWDGRDYGRSRSAMR